MKAAIVQSTFDFAIRDIQSQEGRIMAREDDANSLLWLQAEAVASLLKTPGVTERAIAEKWINSRTGQPYDQKHVHFVAKLWRKFEEYTPQTRPRFRDAYMDIANTSKLKVHHSSESAEHDTPPEIVQLVIACLGEIDLDPCSNTDRTIPANTHYTLNEDGLTQPWEGRVYLNPPYGEGIDRWVTRLCHEHERGSVSEAIALVPARPDTQWFKTLRNYVCCFVEGRLTFGGSTDPAPFPSAIFYLGDDIGKFYDYFAGTGDIWQRLEPGMFAE